MYCCRLPSLGVLRSTARISSLQSTLGIPRIARSHGVITPTRLYSSLISSNPPQFTSTFAEPPLSVVEQIHGRRLQQGKLVLEDGETITGTSFGDFRSVAGEVVFNTGMVGYAESLTDPSYKGQILVMTYPLIGNYGIPADTKDQFGLLEHFESDRIHIRGLIVSDYCEQYSHWKATRSLGQWLQQNNIPALFGIDTRALTQRIRDKTKGIRDKSSLLGKIIADTDVPFEDPNLLNLVAQVSTTGAKTYGHGDVKILALDVGMKNSIIRKLTQRGAAVTVVPWDYDIVSAMEKYDGLLISNGPGDPSTPKLILDNLKKLISQPHPKPIFGICLGHQLLATAAGGNTYKMRYGHRGHNQPCIDLTDGRCYITSQNHGYAVDPSSIAADWEPYFINANDQTSEGVRHKWKPIFSAQFHPEGSGGPEDTAFLFDRFLHAIRQHKNKTYPSAAVPKAATPSTPAVDEKLRDSATLGGTLARGKPLSSFITNHIPQPTTTVTESIPLSTDIPFVPKKVLVLGSGGLQIGQAGEFDYSGSQAIKALKEENIESILINPNIATVQTAKGLADRVYFNPVTPEFVESLIEKERPDGIFLQFGGQTALNCGIELDRRGVLAKYGVRVMGTTVETIIATEDRDIFKAKLQEIGEPIAKSVACTSVDEALQAAQTIGYPVIARAAFSLGGLGSGFAHNAEELSVLCNKAFTASTQVLIERSMRGWKEVEYEVVRDGKDNCVTVCNMENFDPLGIHTGDSIVVAPSQTMDDAEYHLLRRASIRIARHLGIIGECNVQYALHPTSKQYIVIEVNPRLSRSSALASKATGYPLAFVAAKIALGKSLTQIKNSITQVTAACFEPSLDYIVVKIPRWDLQKFSNANTKLGSGMKSVGEVMGIGRSFEEAFQKAIRMVNPSALGFDTYNTKHRINNSNEQELNEVIANATDERLYALAQAFKRGYTVDQIHNMSKIDHWFLNKLERMYRITKTLEGLKLSHLSELPLDLLRVSKEFGFSDKQIATYLKQTPDAIRNIRKQAGIIPVTKQIDTLAAEYPAMTNYLYTTYHGTHTDVDFKDHGILTLGSGCYAIGNSVEFDYSAVSTIRTLRKLGKKTIMLNYNPETVSTDYDESDRLYFDELSLERVLDICDQEKPEGVVVSVGGQIPNNLAIPLAQSGIKLLGTSANMIDQAEDRSKFSSAMDAIGVSQPEWAALTSIEAAYTFCKRVGFAVLVRPSYVLSGAAMKVVRDETALESMLSNAKAVSQEYPVVISKFIQGAKEVDIDGVAQNGETIVYAISEHIEQAGVHSGDATLVFPAQDLTSQQYNSVVEIGKKVAKALKINGPYNAQFIVDGNSISIIECNVRASRSFPFVSKVLDVDFIELATRIMLGGDTANIDPEEVAIDLGRLNFVAVKVPQFSFPRLGGADPVTGVEMASTGEVACYGSTKEEAFLKSLLASNQKLPSKRILIIAGDESTKQSFLPSTQKLIKMGYELFATPGTAQFLRNNKIPVTELSLGRSSVGEKSGPSVLDILAKRGVDYFFTFPSGTTTGSSHSDVALQYRIRRAAVDYSIPICNNVQVANLLVNALYTVKELQVLGSHELIHSIKP